MATESARGRTFTNEFEIVNDGAGMGSWENTTEASQQLRALYGL